VEPTCGEDHEEGYERGEDNEGRDREEPQDLKEAIYPLPAVEPTARREHTVRGHGG